MIKKILWFIKSKYNRRNFKNCRLPKNIFIDNFVELNSSTIDEYVNVAHHAQISNTEIGARTSVGRYSKIQNSKIGKFCSISWDVTIGAVEHPIHSVSTHAFPYRTLFGLTNKDIELKHRNVNIGNDVWVGCGAIIMPGVTIGNGAIIGAGAVVTKNVNPYEIVGGVPAKHINYRFTDEIIQELCEISWWNFSDNIIRDNLNLFSPNNVVDQELILKLKLLAEKNKQG